MLSPSTKIDYFEKHLLYHVRRLSCGKSVMDLCAQKVKSVNIDESLDWKSIYESQTPVIIRGIALSWPACRNKQRRWSIPRFREIVGHINIPIESYGTYMDTKMKIIDTECNEYLNFIESGKSGHFYLAQVELSELNALNNDVIVPTICNTGKGDLYRSNIWLSPPNIDSPCHYDPFQNILCQVFGVKEVYLFPPDQSIYLYPAVGTSQKNTSLVNFENLEDERFPMVQMARGLSVTLQAGDGLFLPYKYWHYCISRTVSCSVNFWWL